MKKIIAIVLLLCLLLTACAGAAEVPDYSALYLQVLDDLWSTDTGLNSDVSFISVDLSQAPGELSPAQKTEIAEAFANKHGAEGLALSQDQLKEQNYLTMVGDNLYQWDDGVLFTITADGEKFDVQKWRSPLGAYYFEDCTAKWNKDGSFKTYAVGSEAIS